MINAIGPIDGRYASKTKVLSAFYSESALIKYRVRIEIEYFLALCKVDLPLLNAVELTSIELRSIYRDFDDLDANRIKEIEQITNHDVKAVEYYLKEKFDDLGIGNFKEFIHLGLTSQDINNTAVPLMHREALEMVMIPAIKKVLMKLDSLVNKWGKVAMLARTHGQPASPTILGKEVRVFKERLEIQLNDLQGQKMSAKFGGATGNFNAHKIAYPTIDWKVFADKLIESLGLVRQQTTTQIEHYDGLAQNLHTLSRICTICIDLCRDFWTYISMDYFKQKVVANEVGSSAMPHKVNPIDFENAEGNFGIAIALATHLAQKLPISRLQRDLSDSTVIRNLGMPMAHAFLALQSLLKGLGKIELNPTQIHADLEKNWAVVAEAYQTILRREGIEKPYELLKGFTRGKGKLTKNDMHSFVQMLAVSETVKIEMLAISPHNYTGYS